jgi:hypothetical protein
MEKTMDMDVQKIKNQIDILANHLQALRDLVSEKLPDLPQRAIARIEKNECLSCGKPLEETPPVKIVRGNHERCYRKITRSIQKGLTTENAAITAGMLTHPDQGGRPEEEAIHLRIARMNEEQARLLGTKSSSRKKTTKPVKAPRKAKGNKSTAILNNPKDE